MPTKGMWFDKFQESMNVLFTEDDYSAYSAMVREEPFFTKYLKEGARVLDVGCGLGCTSVPLSREGYEVVGIDNDARVIEAARQNGRRFGGNVEFLLMDAFEIDTRFERNSFDACIHGGVLEHFSRKQVRILVGKQFAVAPLIICSMPVRTARSLRHYKPREEGGREVFVDGIDRNLWKAEQWLDDVLKGYVSCNS